MANIRQLLGSVLSTDQVEITRGKERKFAALSTLVTLFESAIDTLGSVTGTLWTGNVTGNVTGNLTGGQILPTATTYAGADAPTSIISPAVFHAKLTKDTAGAYTLAAPGASNVGHIMVIEAGTAQAHVITVTGLAGGNTLTLTAAVGAAATLYAVSATVWGIIGLGGAAQSQVG